MVSIIEPFPYSMYQAFYKQAYYFLLLLLLCKSGTRVHVAASIICTTSINFNTRVTAVRFTEPHFHPPLEASTRPQQYMTLSAASIKDLLTFVQQWPHRPELHFARCRVIAGEQQRVPEGGTREAEGIWESDFRTFSSCPFRCVWTFHLFPVMLCPRLLDLDV